jgi:soluble cytochrome b562
LLKLVTTCSGIGQSEAQNPGVAAELAEMEAAIGTLERTIEANRKGVSEEIGLKYRSDIDKVSASVAQEVDDAEARAEAAEQAAAQKVNREEVFAKASALSQRERSDLIDKLLETEVTTVTGGKTA